MLESDGEEMDLIETQKRLIEGVRKVLPNVLVIDNVLPLVPQQYPFIAVDIDTAEPRVYEGGTMPLERYSFSIYVVEALEGHRKNLTETRKALTEKVNIILGIPRLYAKTIEFGEDVINTKNCSLALIKCSFPI
jgi:hypothetical protein